MKLIKKILVVAGILFVGLIMGIFIGFDSSTPVEEAEVIADTRENVTNIPEEVQNTTRKKEPEGLTEEVVEEEPIEEFSDDSGWLSEEEIWHIGESETIDFGYYDAVNNYVDEANRRKTGTVIFDLTDIGIVYGDAFGNYYESGVDPEGVKEVHRILYLDFTR